MGKPLIPLFKPCLAPNTKKYVCDVLDSGWWGLGPKTDEFEQKFAKYVGSKYAVALTSATAALDLSVKLMKDKYAFITKMYTTPLTFISTALVGLYNDLQVEFVDIDKDTLLGDFNNMQDPLSLYIPVHYSGKENRVERTFQIEDCAHAAGSKLSKTNNLRCWSFHAVKNLPTGDGGMITTNNREDYEALRRLRWVGINKSTYERTKTRYGWDYDIQDIGYKCHMDDIVAAIGLAQLEVLDEHNAKRKELVKQYDEALSSINWIELLPFDDRSSNHMYVIKVPAKNRNKIIDYLLENDISAGVHYKPLYKYKMFRLTDKEAKAQLPNTYSEWQRLITLPLFPDLTSDQQNYIIKIIKNYGKL